MKRYIAISEVYLNSNSKIDENMAEKTLLEVIDMFPKRPEAYILLWRKYRKINALQQCMEIAEKVFLLGVDYEAEEIKYNGEQTWDNLPVRQIALPDQKIH